MPVFTPKLPDPRQAPQALASNRLIHTAQNRLAATDDDARAMWQADLVAQLDALAARDDMLMLSVALAMAPTRDVYRVLWQALRQAVEVASGRHAVVFALPVVLVAGCAGEATLPGEVDAGALGALLREHGVFTPGAEVFLSGKLVDPDTVSALSPAQLWRTAREAGTVLTALPELAGRELTVQQDGVFLRYLVGVAMHEAGRPAPVRLGGEVASWGLPMMKFLGQQLKTPGVTLFPIARAPQALLQAVVDGGRVQQDVALQVFVSSQVRRLRDAELTPVAVLAAHDGGELRLTVSAQSGEGAHEGFVWDLSPLDEVADIESTICQLLAECQVSDVHVLAQVQPEEADGVRRFVWAGNIPSTALH